MWNIILLAVVSSVFSAEIKEIAKNGPYGARRGSGFPAPERTVPAFLVNATEELKDNFFEIVDDTRLTIAEINTALEKLAAQNNILEQYYSWQDQQTYSKNWLRNELNVFLNKLSEVESKLENAMDETDATRQLQRRTILNLNRKYPREIAILNNIINQVLTNAPLQGQFTTFSAPKPFGDFDKIGLNEENKSPN